MCRSKLLPSQDVYFDSVGNFDSKSIKAETIKIVFSGAWDICNALQEWNGMGQSYLKVMSGKEEKKCDSMQTIKLNWYSLGTLERSTCEIPSSSHFTHFLQLIQIKFHFRDFKKLN